METKHTPGPWRVGKVGSPMGIHVKIYNFNGLVIAEINGGMSDARANAKLIAQAPDLLAKVSELRQLLLRAEMYVLPTEQTNGLLKEIRKAIDNGK